MNFFEEIDWEVTIDFLKRFGALIVAALWAFAARRRKKSADEEEPEPDMAQDPSAPEDVVIEPGTDAAKLSRQYSQQPL